jgi:hypothetical protein
MYHFFKVFVVTVMSLHERLNRKRASNRGEELKENNKNSCVHANDYLIDYCV